MTKTTKPNSVRFFGRAAETAGASAPTIATPYGTIYAGTPQAGIYLALLALHTPLSALSKALNGMSYDKAQVLADIAALVPAVPVDQAYIRMNLEDLADILQGRLPQRPNGKNFTSLTLAYACAVTDLEADANRIGFGLSCAATMAPKPPHPDARPAPEMQRLGDGAYQRNGN